MLVDSHCHLNMLDLSATNNSLQDILAAAKAVDVNYFLCVATDLEHFPEVLTIAEQHPNVVGSVGLHPNDEVPVEPTVDELIKLATHPRIVAIGETGLDYYRTTGDLTWQHERFRRHIQAAQTVHKPLIIHTREARADTLRILREENAAAVGGVMHCFTEDWAMAEQAIALNFYISFSGIVTFKNAHALQEVAKKVPLERMLIETDAPYLAPVPHRGKPNQPAYVKYVAEFIAQLRGISVAEVAEHTTHNFFELFKCKELVA